MSIDFEELDYRPTPLGDLVLRRRRDPRVGDTDIFEVKLGDEFLMSSLFHASEVALADIGLARLDGASASDPLNIVVGGLGLGYTAHAALRDSRVGQLLVVELLEGVIDWHRRRLVPLGEVLTGDDRCRFVQGDFFKMAADPATGFDAETPGRRFDAVLLDIDHAPGKLIDAASESFYLAGGLTRLAGNLRSAGVFGLWSDDPPEAAFVATLESVFDSVQTQVIGFDNPYTGAQSSCSVYTGIKR